MAGTMQYFGKLRRQMMVSLVTRDLSPYVMECTRAAMVLTFTDEQLEREYVIKKYRYSRWKWLQNKVDAASDNQLPFSDVNHRMSELIEEYCEEAHSPVYLVRLRTLAAAIDRVKIKYGDPSQDGYQTAMDSGAEIALTIQTALKYTSHNAKSEFQITAAQEECLVAVMFLLRQSGDDDFYPSFVTDATTVDRWLTARILAAPDDAERNAAAFRDRMSRLREIELKLTVKNSEMKDYDALCDYPDELIDRLSELMFSNFHVWDDFCRYVLTDNKRNNQQTVNEMLCFMGPFVAELNMRYLSGTIPRLLRGYECLPHMDDYSKSPEGLREQCEALLLVSIAIDTTLHGEAKTPFTKDDQTLRDQRLVDLLMARPELADTIARAVEEREIADFESLDQVSSGVLGNGAL